MAKLETVMIFNKPHNAPMTEVEKFDPAVTGKEILGRKIGPWLVANTGRHTKWGVYDAATGMRLAHAMPSLKSATDLLKEIEAAGLEFEKSDGRDYVDGPRWGDSKSYKSESIRAVALIVRPYLEKLGVRQ
jgi:hypothetical protein